MEIDLGRVLGAPPAIVWIALPDGHIDSISRHYRTMARGLRLRSPFSSIQGMRHLGMILGPRT